MRIGWHENRAKRVVEILGAGMRIEIEDVGAPASQIAALICRALNERGWSSVSSEGADAPATGGYRTWIRNWRH